MENEKENLSDFWKIEDLIPQRRERPAPLKRSAPDTSAAEVTAPAPATESGSTVTVMPQSAPRGDFYLNLPPKERTMPQGAAFASSPAPATELRTGTEQARDVLLTEHFVPPHRAGEADNRPEPDEVYAPENSLVREVRIYRPRNEYTYYEQFCRHARQLYAREGTECPPVEFFSYMPQYSQLDRAGLAFYLWWRTCFRRGEAIEAPYSYLLLYLYEVINLKDVMSPQEGQAAMLRLWLSYRARYPRLDVLIREWLCDYSLLYRLPPPTLPPELFRDLLSGCRLKEFYVAGGEGNDTVTRAVLLFCNNYDYRKSKFYRPDTAELFERVLTGAVTVALDTMREKRGAALTDESGVSTLTRDAFSGAICSYRLKRRIEVSYSSFSHTHELRYVITDVLKYAENAVRGAIGVKSRLSVYDVNAELRARLDAYFKQALPPRPPVRVARKAEETPDYEKRYDLPVRELSAARAAEIEAASWETTKRLVEAFAEPIPPADTENEVKIGFNPVTVCETEEKPSETPTFSPQTENGKAATVPPSTENAPQTENAEPSLAEALFPHRAFLAAALAGDRALERRLAGEAGRLVDEIADEINTVAGDIFGDILLEDAGGYYTVLTDYREMLNELSIKENDYE